MSQHEGAVMIATQDTDWVLFLVGLSHLGLDSAVGVHRRCELVMHGGLCSFAGYSPHCASVTMSPKSLWLCREICPFAQNCQVQFTPLVVTLGTVSGMGLQ